jgi:hypothetical protein
MLNHVRTYQKVHCMPAMKTVAAQAAAADAADALIQSSQSKFKSEQAPTLCILFE